MKFTDFLAVTGAVALGTVIAHHIVEYQEEMDEESPSEE